MNSLIYLIDLGLDDSLEDIKEGIKRGSFDCLLWTSFPSNSNHDEIVKNYIIDYQFEIEVDHPFLYLVLPDNSIKAYQYKVIDYEKSLYEVYEVKIGDNNDSY